jgi:hypothetical protein
VVLAVLKVDVVDHTSLRPHPDMLAVRDSPVGSLGGALKGFLGVEDTRGDDLPFVALAVGFDLGEEEEDALTVPAMSPGPVNVFMLRQLSNSFTRVRR